ncbi:hypothetical protein K9L63_02855 [Candidatus Gracilibacteria bacterium]|nr:hypothetical protein [Candidatus Gracilibacteria bacterium]
MEINRIINLRRLGFREFLEDDEGIVRAFRTPFIFALNRMVFRAVLWGGISTALWFFLPEKYAIVWAMAGVFAVYKVFSVFARWYVNAALMTTESLVFIDWPKFFTRKSTRLDFWDIDEIEVERVGVASFLYNYGTLRFQKYGGELHAVHKIYRPGRVAKIIEKYREQFLDAKNFTEESALKDLLSNMVQTHVRSHGQPEREGGQEQGRKSQGQEKKEKKKEPFLKKVFKADEMSIEVEKEMDDEGGFEMDLDEK